MKNLLQKVLEYALNGLVLVGVLLCAYGVLKTIVAPLAPITTVIFVVVLTFWSCDSRQNVLLSIGGIALYASSWFVFSRYGAIPSMFFWSAGVIMWFVGVFRKFDEVIRLSQTIRV
jgi:hypothetical protein